MKFFKNQEQVAASNRLFGSRVVDMLSRTHDDSLWILENIGVRCCSKVISKIFQDLEADGSAILYDDRIYLSSDLVLKCLSTVPGINDFFIPQASFFIGGRAAFLWDDVNGRSGIVPTADHMARIVEICEEKPIVAGMGPGIMMADEVNQMDIMTSQCTKPLYFSVSSSRAVQRAVEIHKSRGRIMVSFCLTRHPLEVNDQNSDFFVKVVQSGVPVFLAALPMAGISAPYSYNGVLSVAHAEALFAICAAQLLNPGCTCVHGGLPSVADPRYGYSPNYGLQSHFVLNLLMAHLNMMLDLPTIQSAGTTHERGVTPKALEDARISQALCKKYGFHMMRHCFGFLRGMIDLSLEKLEKVIRITETVTVEDAPEIHVPNYDDQAMEAVRRSGLTIYRDDPLTTANIGKIFLI